MNVPGQTSPSCGPFCTGYSVEELGCISRLPTGALISSKAGNMEPCCRNPPPSFSLAKITLLQTCPVHLSTTGSITSLDKIYQKFQLERWCECHSTSVDRRHNGQCCQYHQTLVEHPEARQHFLRGGTKLRCSDQT